VKAYTPYEQGRIIKTNQMYFYIQETVEENDIDQYEKEKEHKQECSISEIDLCQEYFYMF
jgi:hypothetical protein